MFIVPGKEGGFVLYGIEGKTKTDRASIKMTLNQIFTDEPNLKINGVFMAKDYAVNIGEAAKGEKNFKEAYDVLQEIKAEVKAGRAPEVAIPKIPEEAKTDKPKEASETAKQQMEALKKKTGVKPR
jgi:pyruvate-formate lyase